VRYADDITTVYHGDALQTLDYVGDASVDLVFADPPYNIGKKFGNFKDSWPSDEAYAEWCYTWLALCLSKLKANGSLYVMTSTQAMPYLDLWLRSRTTILSRIVWHYDSSGVQAKHHFGSLYEPILFCVKDPKNYTFNAKAIEVEAKTGAARQLIDYRKGAPTLYNATKVPGNTWYIPRVRYRMAEYEEHPSQKPEALLERVIRASSNEGDLILDPFAGTFTTCAVARRLKRRSVGIEMQPDYIKVGLRRLGLATHFNGEKLLPLNKTYARKNGKNIRNNDGAEPDLEQIALFDAET
jgi:adenine-specific DNA-methyltransferase